MNDGNYFLKVNEQAEGPFTIGQIYDFWAARKINSHTLFARSEDMEKWQPLSDLTLRISPPKAAASAPAPKEPAPEAPVSQPKPRALAAPWAEPLAPSIPSHAAERKGDSPAPTPREPAAVKRPERFALSMWAGLCVVIGIALTAAFIFFLSFPGPAKEPGDERQLFLYQSGALAGVGLFLLGGLLQVAARLEQLGRQKIEEPKSAPRKIGSLL